MTTKARFSCHVIISMQRNMHFLYTIRALAPRPSQTQRRRHSADQPQQRALLRARLRRANRKTVAESSRLPAIQSKILHLPTPSRSAGLRRVNFSNQKSKIKIRKHVRRSLPGLRSPAERTK
jgi:hypothetical protein